MNSEISLLVLWINLCMSQQSNLKFFTRKTYNNSMIQQLNWLELVLHGELNQGHSTGEVCWKYFCILALVLPPYLHQFSTISGGNCIRLTSLIVRLPS